MAIERQRARAVLRGALHRPPAESAAQDGAQVAEHGLAADDEDPGIHDGVQGVEAERPQVLVVAAKRVDGVDEACDLQKRERKSGVGVEVSVGGVMVRNAHSALSSSQLHSGPSVVTCPYPK